MLSALEIEEKLSVFKDPDFVFKEDTHEYFYKGRKLVSGSTFAGQFKKEFDSDKMSYHVAKRDGMTQDEVLSMWKAKNDRAKYLGTEVHKWIEDCLNGLEPGKHKDNEVMERVGKWKELHNNRLSGLKNVSQELRIFSEELGLAGTIDILFYNKDYFVVGDWKTNEKLTTDDDKHYNMMKYPFHHEKENKFNEYSLQISIYALILERNGIFCDFNFLAYMPPDGPGRIYWCKDYRQILKMYFGIV